MESKLVRKPKDEQVQDKKERSGLGIKEISGWISAASGVVGLLSTFMKQVKEVIPGLSTVPTLVILSVSVVLLLIAFLIQRKRLTRHSTLMDPDALVATTGVDNLVGRADDIERLLDLIASSPLIWLVGESGAGKSALLQAGIVPRLEARPNRLPIYIDNWGTDWAQGPCEAMTEALNEQLAKRPAAEAHAPVTPANLIGRLAQMRNENGLIPVLLLDQFDDYQLRHRNRFVTEAGKVLNVAELMAANEFWRAIGDLLQANAIRVLFATRQDTAYGLESVRFMEPQTYPLDRLRRGNVLPLLQRLTDNDAVAHPENGWQQLQSMLSHDLEAEGSVLPIQMRVAIRSLGSLRELTPANYRKNGGLRGLEASHIEYHLKESERQAPLNRDDALRLVLSMVERVSGKTIARTEEDVSRLFPANRYTGGEVGRALSYLVSREVLRMRFNPDSRSQVWQLDHDYLCRGVLEVDRRAHYWARYLQDSADAFYGARGIWKKWRALLGPIAQFRILVDRLRGRLRYGNNRWFAVWSAFRLVPAAPFFLFYSSILLYLAILVGWGLVESFHPNAPVTPAKAVQSARPQPDDLWSLAKAGYAQKRQTLEARLTDDSDLTGLRRDLPAVVGVDPDMRSRIVRDVVSRCYTDHPSSGSPRASRCDFLIDSLDLDSRQAVEYYLAPARNSTNLATVQEAANKIRARWQPIPTEALTVLTARLDALLDTASPSDLPYTARLYTQLGPAANRAKPARVLAALAIRQDKLGELRLTGDTLKLFLDSLPVADQSKVFVHLVEVLKSAPPSQWGAEESLSELPGPLSAADADSLIQQFASGASGMASYGRMQCLDTLGVITRRLNAEDHARIVEHVLRVVLASPDPLCDGLAAFATKDDLSVMLDVLKWPTCGSTARLAIMNAIAKANGRTFPRLTDNPGTPYIWDFVSWAGQSGANLKDPPGHYPRARQ